MPAFLLMLLGGLGAVAGSLAGRVLVALGVGFVAFSGLDVLMDAVEAAVSGAFGGLPAHVLAILGTLQLDVCLNIYLSALSAKMVLMGIGPNGVVTRMLTR